MRLSTRRIEFSSTCWIERDSFLLNEADSYDDYLQELEKALAASNLKTALAVKTLVNQLESFAKENNKDGFLSLIKATKLEGFPPDVFILAIRTALELGLHLVARQLSSDGFRLYPNNLDLKKYAHVLSPPKMVRSDLPADKSVGLNQRWLKNNREEYLGRWVALKDGKLVHSADSVQELRKNLNPLDKVLITAVY